MKRRQDKSRHAAIEHLCSVQVSRLLPWTIKNYKLDEIVTLGELRRNVSLLFRQHANVTDPKVRLGRVRKP
jgi:hypothetical protein